MLNGNKRMVVAIADQLGWLNWTDDEIVRRALNITGKRSARWDVLGSAGALGVIAALGILSLTIKPAFQPAPATPSVSPHILEAIVTYRLFPGVRKGDNTSMISIAPPAQGQSVRLLLEVPEVRVSPSTEWSVRLISLADSRNENPAWTSSKPITLRKTAGGQEIELLLDATVLKAGDYIVEADENGEARFNYLIRVL
jgi:hypothetical protein